jgi:hypothetical protein
MNEGALSMKMEITVRIKNTDGTEEIRPIVVGAEIPEFEEFTGPDNFREVFDKYEKAVLKIRNKAAESATDEYLSGMSKKTRGQSRRARRSNDKGRKLRI